MSVDKVFRILVLGESKAGKSTLIKKWCQIDDEPVVRNRQGDLISLPGGSLERGQHDIEEEIFFEKLPGFVFHDSRGFEAGSTDELDRVRSFIQKMSSKSRVKDQLHIIWHCIPCGRARRFTNKDMENIQIYNGAAGALPVITIFTKVDLESVHVLTQNYPASKLRSAVRSARQTISSRIEECKSQIRESPCPPFGFVELRDMNKENAEVPLVLTRMTADAINDSTIRNLLVSSLISQLPARLSRAIQDILISVSERFRISTSQKEISTLASAMWRPFGPIYAIVWNKFWNTNWDDDWWADDYIWYYADWNNSSDEWWANKDSGRNAATASGYIPSSGHLGLVSFLGGLCIAFMPRTPLDPNMDLGETLRLSFQRFRADHSTQWSDTVKRAYKDGNWFFKSNVVIADELTKLVYENLMP